jgi:cobalt/nickel transport system permease protein
MTVVLSIQRLLFADGGVFALGANVFNMAVIGSLGGYLAMRALRAMLPAGRAGLLASVAAASWLSVVLASAACALELALSGRSPLPVVLPAMVGTHAVIGAGEALIAAAVLAAVAGRRPDILPDWAGLAEKRDGPAPLRRRVWIPAAVGLAVALALAAFVSPFKSGAPDGLEKTIEAKKIAAAGPEPKGAWNWTPFADYSIGGVGSGKLSTALAGILGTAGVFAVGFGAIRLFLGRAGSLHSRRG